MLVGMGSRDDRAQAGAVERHRGETTEVAKTPSSKRRSLKRMAAAASPTMTGVMGVSEAPVSKPRRASSALKRRVLAHSRSNNSGSPRA